MSYMSTGNATIETSGFGPDFEIDGHTIKSRQHGRLMIAEIPTRARMMSDGTPVTDWSHIADRVDVTDFKVGDHMGTGRSSFAQVVEAPRPWRNFTKVVTHESRPGDLPQTMDHKFKAGGQAWRLRVSA
jgi:hypothetical protein